MSQDNRIMETELAAVVDPSASESDVSPSARPVSSEVVAEGHVRDDHLTVIQARSPLAIVDMAELWRFRELLGFMVWRDVKVRYKQTVLGAAWAILQPTAQMVVFSIFFGRMAEVPTGGIPYPLFAFTGLLPWIFLQNSVTSAANSVVANQNIISKVYFPRLYIPASAVGASLVDFGVAVGMMIALIAWYRVTPGISVALAPALIVLLALVAFGIGTLLSALTVSYRDFRYVVPFLVQLWMFATPSVYMDTSTIGPRWHAILPINPAYGMIQNFRAAALGRHLDLYSLCVSGGVGLILVLIGGLYFRHAERTFADII